MTEHPPSSSSESPGDAAPERKASRSTSTKSFGAGRRESHDATAFYERFTQPEISTDRNVVSAPSKLRDQLLLGTAQDLLGDDSSVLDNSVGLVVTSPPYFVGKDYEEAVGQGHVPAEYGDHLAILKEVFALCVAKLEPGGRIAVNVANLGRRPYRSQSADVIRIFEELGLLLRGELIWSKGKGLSGSTAWGSFQQPSNPVLRDTSERIIIASKGRFDRALTRAERSKQGLPANSSLTREAFMNGTLDVWEIPAESASRVGHPAPFPVGLPLKLIELYTYVGDLVLDPFMGAGTTAVAAMRSDRHYVGCETDSDYLEISRQRVSDERQRLVATREAREKFQVRLPAVKGDVEVADDEPAQAKAVREGRKAEDIAEGLLIDCGFEIVGKNQKFPSGVEIDFIVRSSDKTEWHVDVTGSFTSDRGGLTRTDTLWKSLGKAAMRDVDSDHQRFILLTTALPRQGVGLKALRSARDNRLILDALEMFDARAIERLAEYQAQGDSCEAAIGELLVPEKTDALFG